MHIPVEGSECGGGGPVFKITFLFFSSVNSERYFVGLMWVSSRAVVDRDCAKWCGSIETRKGKRERAF